MARIYPGEPVQEIDDSPRSHTMSATEALFSNQQFLAMLNENGLAVRDFMNIYDRQGNSMNGKDEHPYHVYFIRSDRMISDAAGNWFIMADIGRTPLIERWWDPELEELRDLTVNEFIRRYTLNKPMSILS